MDSGMKNLRYSEKTQIPQAYGTIQKKFHFVPGLYQPDKKKYGIGEKNAFK